jgi:hypothetical protein
MLSYTRQVVQIEKYESTGLNKKTAKSPHEKHMHHQPLSSSLSYPPFLPAILPAFLPAFIHLPYFISEGCTACEPRNSTVDKPK